MPTIRPIPKRLLIHSIMYIEKMDGDGWNDSSSPAPIDIERVRVDAATSITRDSDKRSVTADHVLFIDRVHSSQFFRMKEGSTVEFNGREWKVESVKEFYDFREQPHHYEVGLV
ncbi:putative minor capsid protein [Alteribacillus sp. JSM 102045]|uniref:putative minor capsid protein n=1 Tax=Alteribacillus sp. JSM 102045 TaxID=1562101 RepID=UPI0035C0E8E3